MRVGADSGGTFTDVVGTNGRILKLPSTPEDPGVAVRDGVRQLAGPTPLGLAHGTTVATNALLERRGATVALVTNDGLADVIEIGRQDRPHLYDQWVDRPVPLVRRVHRYEIPGRLAADGSELEPLELDALARLELDDEVEVIVVCLLHADLDPSHELRVAAALRAEGHDVCTSVEVSPQYREFERCVSAVVNAYLQPVCRPYLLGLAEVAPEVAVMASSGGLLDVATAAELPASILLSGPAAGVSAAAAIATACGYRDALSFDMGGTSTDVCLILDGAPAPAAGRVVDGYPVRLPSLDIHTVGAGGGSIGWIDPGGALRVGPRSAGARPGPACYGHGGTEPTVTDADLVAGHLATDTELSGIGRLDLDAATAALTRRSADAHGMLAVVNAEMEQALRTVSVQRGVDPRGLALVAFGGAGPLHACDLAAALGIEAVIVPPAAGVLSAVGLLTSPRRRELVRSWATPAEHDGLEVAVAELSAEVVELLPGAEVEVSFECRYAGQSHELRVSQVEQFHDAHEQRNGYARRGDVIEVVALRAVAELVVEVAIEDVLAPWAASPPEPVEGPATITREDCAVWVPDGWAGSPGPLGSLILRPAGATDA